MENGAAPRGEGPPRWMVVERSTRLAQEGVLQTAVHVDHLA